MIKEQYQIRKRSHSFLLSFIFEKNIYINNKGAWKENKELFFKKDLEMVRVAFTKFSKILTFLKSILFIYSFSMRRTHRGARPSRYTAKPLSSVAK